MNINELIHQDGRVQKIKQEYNQLNQKKNELILVLSAVESDLIKHMGGFEILNKLAHPHLPELLKGFHPLVAAKRKSIMAVASIEFAMKRTEKSFENLANMIVDELKAKAGIKTPQSGECGCQSGQGCGVCLPGEEPQA